MAWLPGFLARTPTFSRLSYKAVVETPSILNGDEGHSFSWNCDHSISSIVFCFFLPNAPPPPPFFLFMLEAFSFHCRGLLWRYFQAPDRGRSCVDLVRFKAFWSTCHSLILVRVRFSNHSCECPVNLLLKTQPWKHWTLIGILSCRNRNICPYM